MEFSYRCRLQHIRDLQDKQLIAVRTELDGIDRLEELQRLARVLKVTTDRNKSNKRKRDVQEFPGCAACAEGKPHLHKRRVRKKKKPIENPTTGACGACARGLPHSHDEQAEPVKKRRARRKRKIGPVLHRPVDTVKRRKELNLQLADLENHELVNQFHLDSAALFHRHTLAKKLISSNPPNSEARLTGYQQSAEIHKEFLDKFGRELQPKAPQRNPRKRYKKTSLPTSDIPPDSCEYCEQLDCMIDSRKEATYVCTLCGSVKSYGVAHGIEGMTFAETKNIQSAPYTYKPISHLEDLLMQVQGKSGREIPPALLGRLRNEFRKTRVPTHEITPQRVRGMLRKIRFSNFYDEIHNIAHKLNPAYKPIIIREEHYKHLCMMFNEVYDQFPLVVSEVSPERKNFLSYHGFAKAMCDFLGYRDYLPAFTALKSSAKRQAQGKILGKIFTRMNFEYRYID